MKLLSEILKPFNPDDAEKALSILKEFDAKSNKSVFWYSSAGFDLKPLHYFSDKIAGENGLPKVDYFLYNSLSDSDFNIAKKHYIEKTEYDMGVMFDDGEVLIAYENFIPLVINRDKVNYIVSDSNFYVSSKFTYEGEYGIDAGIFELKAIPVKGDDQKVTMIYFEMENENFCNEVLNHLNIKPTYFCTVCDGCGFGGNMKCTADIEYLLNEGYKKNDRGKAYPYIEKLKPEYWVTDHVRLPEEIKWGKDIRSEIFESRLRVKLIEQRLNHKFYDSFNPKHEIKVLKIAR